MKNTTYKATLSKFDTIFDMKKFRTLEAAIRWGEELRFEDNYLISVYCGNDPEPCVSYIYSRNAVDLDYTTNLFSRFR